MHQAGSDGDTEYPSTCSTMSICRLAALRVWVGVRVGGGGHLQSAADERLGVIQHQAIQLAVANLVGVSNHWRHYLHRIPHHNVSKQRQLIRNVL